ncbi:hypothetical protein P154DRAFT_524575 [Amniculicola lignicola CBS 123094]|uniref:BZIP domain-containing protein n=1 Tax=Amniculicola lignicola CBS 123094 TaxID=1392246 RepID=A0A6A5W8I9_9PLEO|nr:hypothetical protein P154DRAFT_524575 [Amniculicola lignicola CBS 123094]
MMKNFTFRQYKRSPKEDPKEPASSSSKDKESASYLKRREQVRRAQRTHRERKEGYIKSLETEVLQLRTNESKILQETRNLYAEITRLKRILDHHGIRHGSQQAFDKPQQLLDSSSSAGPSSSSISVVTNPQQNLQLHLRGFGGSGTGSDLYLSESESAPSQASKAPRRKKSFFGRRGRSESDSNAGGSNYSGSAPLQPDITEISRIASNLCLGDMDQTSLGIEFVLTLEAPCLGHTQGDPSNPSLPTGHALTATAPLLFQCPTQPVSISPTAASSNTTWETPNFGLQTLLSLSDNLPLSDELTPVQAWQQIRSHPDFSAVGVPGLRRLTEDMLKNVKCYGFGAVIETEVFATLLGGLFPGTVLNFNFWGEE